MNCKNCRANCSGAKQDREIALCLWYDPPKTNADRIRAMSDEELAEWIFNRVKCQNCYMLPCVKHGDEGNGNCMQLWLDWLKQEEGTCTEKS